MAIGKKGEREQSKGLVRMVNGKMKFHYILQPVAAILYLLQAEQYDLWLVVATKRLPIGIHT